MEQLKDTRAVSKEEMTMQRSLDLFRLVAGMGVAFALSGGPLQAQESDGAGLLVARYAVEPTAFDDVTNSVELTAALRRILTVEASMPLDEPLRVDLMGEIRDPIAGGSHPFNYKGLGFEVGAGETESGTLETVIRASHGPGSAYDDGDWSDETAWTWLQETVEEGLTSSQAADGSFARDAEGGVPLRVTKVHSVSFDNWDVEDGLGGIYLKLQPGAGFASSSDGNWVQPADFGYDVKVLLLELEPGPQSEQLQVAVSAEALERVIGVYEPGPGGEFEVRSDGDAIVGIIRRSGREALEVELVPLSATTFIADVNEQRVQLSFETDGDGAASEVSVQQGGIIQVWPRLN